ncbi:unnamed protein product, partial [Musa hybrid cultivar]
RKEENGSTKRNRERTRRKSRKIGLAPSLDIQIKIFERSARHSSRCLIWAEAVDSYSELWASLVGCYAIVV